MGVYEKVGGIPCTVHVPSGLCMHPGAKPGLAESTLVPTDAISTLLQKTLQELPFDFFRISYSPLSFAYIFLKASLESM